MGGDISMVITPIVELKIEGISLDSLTTKAIQLILGPMTLAHLVGALDAARHIVPNGFDVKIGGRNYELYAQLTNQMVRFFALWNVCMDSPLAANFAPVVAMEMVLFTASNAAMNHHLAFKCARWLPGFFKQGHVTVGKTALPEYTESYVPRTRQQTTECLKKALAYMDSNSRFSFLG